MQEVKEERHTEGLKQAYLGMYIDKKIYAGKVCMYLNCTQEGDFKLLEEYRK